jgi:hypothetical protein
MEARIVQLLSSIVTTTAAYTLARLEFALRHPDLPAPPLIDRLSDASGVTLQAQWERMERQLEVARAFLREHDDVRAKRAVYDASFAWLQRTVRDFDQYARAMRWVLTAEDAR